MSLPDLRIIHQRYLLLSRLIDERLAGAAGGKLLLRRGFDAPGVADTVAASLAGMAVLCLDGDAERLRAGLRSGFCDFVVGHLDEALRILKNEVRRQRAVSVGLTGDPAGWLAEMAERGVQPDVLAEVEDAGGIFVERGALELREGQPEAGTSLLCWRVATDAARLMPRLAEMAGEALDEARADTAARRRWLERAPRYLGRAYAGRQCLRMTPDEAAAFATAARSGVPEALLETGA